MSDKLSVYLVARSSKVKNKILLRLLESLNCSICHDYMFVPMMTPCGHNFCYGCLNNWITGGSKDLNCPQCRSTINEAPRLNLILRETLDSIIEFLNEKKKVSRDAQFKKIMESKSMELSKYKKDLDKDNLFESFFKNSAMAVVDEDDDEGIPRCSNCHWEIDPDDLEDNDNVCPHCNMRIRNSVQNISNRNSEVTNLRTNDAIIVGLDDDEYSSDEIQQIHDDLVRHPNADSPEIYSDSDLESDSNEDEESLIPRKQSNKHRDNFYDDEASEDYDEEDNHTKINRNEDRISINSAEDSEDDSDLDGFIEHDDDALRDDGGIVVNEAGHISSNDEEEQNSDYYEHNDDEGFVSGDSLNDESDESDHLEEHDDEDDEDDDEDDEDEDDGDDDDDDRDEERSRKRQRRSRVVLDGSDDE
ncbi:ubiquitin-protein ligase PSH1 NDAI_0E00440 [Naumovozyma dairenensis CBS 421]|uniref:RING-type domain-containing protein n=1 Tax=Naumovozyma dairenensis (strain ATCC 10597 / BCRC 20456 / CBS 421 / NBRC 0211 / NRRL Y-12639) TaxID=1071378 RepID=G0WAU0_NAUDC|nr:hypothetical protein NDAI_0E00440 [Naumovozyma dairenensis CBS 421]CCD24860.1 hypothetical protein NDAI_0E00440 [Naumovozyma dairenensis CBS 421]